MGAVGGYGKIVSVSKTIAAGGNYDANDVLSNSASNGAGTDWDFEDCARGNGGSFEIRGVRFYCSAGGVALTPRLHLFTTAPTTSEMDDAATFNLTTADRTKYKGYIEPSAAFADMGDFAFAQNDDLAKQITCASGSRDLYGILETRTAETGESANMTITVELEIIQF